MKTKTWILFFLAYLAAFSTHAQETIVPEAPTPDAGPKMELIKANKGKISVSFDDELVRGSTQLPEGDLITNKLENRFKRFIKLRKDFIQDVESTKDEFGNR